MQRLKSRHSQSRGGQRDSDHLASLHASDAVTGLEPLAPMSPGGRNTAKQQPQLTPRQTQLDSVTIASQESHEEAIKKTLELMNSKARQVPQKLQSPAEPSHQDVHSSYAVPTVRKASNSFLPSLASGLSTPCTLDELDAKSGVSSPTTVQQRKRSTPQLPPPPSRQRPGPEFPRTVLGVTVPEISESQTSLLMNADTRGNEHVAASKSHSTPVEHAHREKQRSRPKGASFPDRSSTSRNPAPEAGGFGAESASPVAVVCPVQNGARSASPARHSESLDSYAMMSPSEMGLSAASGRPFSILSSGMASSDSDALQKVLRDMTDVLDTVLTNEKMLLGMPGPGVSTKEQTALHGITDALVSVHDQFTGRMRQVLDGDADGDVMDPDLQTDISQLLLGYLSLTARTVRAQCSAMNDRIKKQSSARQGQLDEVKEDFLAEKIKWAAEMNKTKENLQSRKELLEKQQEMLQSVGTSLQLERQHLEDVVTEMPPDVRQQVKERVFAQQQQQQQHSRSMSNLSLSSHELLADGERPLFHRSIVGLATESQINFGSSRKSCVPGRTEMFALRDLQEEKTKLEKLLCRHQMELKTLKEQHDWARSGMAVMSETKRVAEQQVDLERKQALRTQSDLQVKLTSSEANAHRFEEMWSLEKRKQEELSGHLLRASAELDEARAEIKVKAQMSQELQLLRQQLTEQVTVQQRLRNQLVNSQRVAREMQERLNQSAARWVRSKKDEERERIEKKWQKITQDAVQLKRAQAFHGAKRR